MTSYIPPKRIVIVEDNKEYVDTLQEIISFESELDVVAIYYDAESAKNTLELDFPDLVIIDMNLVQMPGIELLTYLKGKSKDCKFMVLTASTDSELVFEALRSGAIGYIVKSLSIDQIIQSIKDVLNGGATMSPEISELVIKSFWKNTNSPLSAKETEILQLMSEGNTYEGIAEKLFNSKETIKWHIKNIYSKLAVENRAQAIEIAKRNRYF